MTLPTMILRVLDHPLESSGSLSPVLDSPSATVLPVEGRATSDPEILVVVVASDSEFVVGVVSIDVDFVPDSVWEDATVSGDIVEDVNVVNTHRMVVRTTGGSKVALI